MNDVVKQKGGFYNNSIYYTDTDLLYIQNIYWSSLVNNGFVGNSLGLGKKNYGISFIFYASCLAPKIKYCLMDEIFGAISAKKTFKGCSEEHRLVKLSEFLSLSEKKRRFQVDFQMIGRKLLKE